MTDVLLVDRQRLFREGIKAILATQAGFRVSGEAGDGMEAVQFAKKHHPPLILTGMRLAGLAGADLIAEVLKCSLDSKVVVVSSVSEEQAVVQAVRAGARAYLLKDCTARDLIECVGVVVKGGSYLSPTVADMLLDKINSGSLDTNYIPSKLESLRPREVQILRMVANGKQNKEIATALSLQEHTIRSYRKNLMKTTGLTSVADMTRFAISVGLCDKGGLDDDH